MTDAVLLPKLKKLSSQLHFIKTIVFFGDAKKSLINEFPEHIKIYSLQQVIDLGSKLKNSKFYFGLFTILLIKIQKQNILISVQFTSPFVVFLKLNFCF